MRCYGRTEWGKDDLFAAHDELERQVKKLWDGMHKQMKGVGQAAAGNETG
jgi:hypothetical protein